MSHPHGSNLLAALGAFLLAIPDRVRYRCPVWTHAYLGLVRIQLFCCSLAVAALGNLWSLIHVEASKVSHRSCVSTQEMRSASSF
jgi:hypothetical protein